MLKKTIEFVDYDGNARKETYYFNLSRPEITEMEVSVEGGLSKSFEKVIEDPEGGKASIVRLVREVVLKSFGEKSPDGKRFIKSEELSKAFEQSEAYSELYVELLTKPEALEAFFKGIIPEIKQ